MGTLLRILAAGAGLVLCLATARADVTGKCDSGYTFVSATSSCYRYVPQTLTWTDAEAFCVAEGGHLVSIYSATEAALAYQACSAASKRCWVGLNDQAVEGTWRWTASPTVPSSSYSLPWSGGQPDNAGNSDCVHFTDASGDAASISDASCEGSSFHFICKKPEGCPPGNYKSGSSCVACPKGTYSSSSNSAGSCTPCSAGRYGSVTGQTSSSCSGLVSAGYYSISAATSPTENPCPPGRFASSAGSSSSQCEGPIAAGYYGGQSQTSDKPVFKKCDAGRYGGLGQTSSSCSGACDVGYYCPAGSSSSKANACGGATAFCPAGSAAPSTVRTGYYTKPETGNTRASEALCEQGYYCTGGVRAKCKQGYYGADTGKTTETCTGACDIAGFLCPAGSTKKTEQSCGDGQTNPAEWYCPAGAAVRSKVSAGHYSTPLSSPESQRSGQAACEEGFSCSLGIRSAKIAFTGPGELCTVRDTTSGASLHDYVGEVAVSERTAAAATATIGVASAVGTPTYSLTSSSAATGCSNIGGQSVGVSGHPFAISASSASSVSIAAKAGLALDYESCSAYSIVLSATKDGTTAKCTVTVRVRDVNDPPEFVEDGGAVVSSASRTVPEGSSQNTLVGLPLMASDQDAGQELRFFIASGDPDGVFAIGACSGQVHVGTSNGAQLLDHESNGPTGSMSPHFRLIVTVQDNGSPTFLARNLTLSITVTDVEERPYFTKTSYGLAVDENSPAGTLVTPASGFVAADPDGPSSVLSWSLTALDGDGSGGAAPFTIGASTGKVYVAAGAQLNFERRSSMRVQVMVTDGVFETKLEDTIAINDVNDPPIFTGKDLRNGVVSAAILEGAPVGSLIRLPSSVSSEDLSSTPELVATDEDAGASQAVTWGVENANTAAVPFVITETTAGKRVALGSAAGPSGLDFETLLTAARASPTPSLQVESSSARDVPVFVINVTVTDATGAMARVPFRIAVADVNENPVVLGDNGLAAADPTLGTASASLMREVPENAPAGTPVGIVGMGRALMSALSPSGTGLAANNLSLALHAAVNATDVDFDQSMFFSLVDAGAGTGPPTSVTPAGLFDVDRTSGVIRTLKSLDREDASMGGPVYFVRLKVCDNGPSSLCDEADVRIEVLDVNEAPSLSAAQFFTLAENAAPGTQAKVDGVVGAAVAASDPDSADQTGLTFSIRSGLLDINGSTTKPLFQIGASSGAISVAPGTSTADHWTSVLNFEAAPMAVKAPTQGGTSAAAEAMAAGNYFRVAVRVCDNGVNGAQLCADEVVVVALTNVPEAPRVVAGQSRSVTEQSAAGTQVGATPLRAEDQDAGETASLQLRDGTSPASSQFSISTSGVVTLTTNAPALSPGETARPETVQVIATDSTSTNSPPVAATLIIAAENFRPVVTAEAFFVPENAAVNHLVGTVQASDDNAGQVLTFFADAFDPPAAKSLFTVDEATGQVRVAASLDFETLSTIVITVLAQDDGPGNKQGTEAITITVTDVPEPPVVTGPLALVVNETTPAGEGPLPLPPLGSSASSPDAVRLFEPLAPAGISAWRSGSSPPGYQAKGVHWSASDASLQARINATDQDIGEAATLTYKASAVSRASATAVPLQAGILPGGAGGYTSEDLAAWGIESFPVAADPATGRLALVSGGVDFELLPPAEPWVLVNISVIDTAGLGDWTVVRLWVLDVNERPVAAGAAFEVAESAAVGATLISRTPGSSGLTAQDPDRPSLSHSALAWSIDSGNEEGRFRIDPLTGQLSISSPVDWEDREAYTLVIRVRDSPSSSGAASAGKRVLSSLSTTVQATVTVLNVADMRITGVFGATTHASAGGEWVYFQGVNLGPTPRKLAAMIQAQNSDAVAGDGVAAPRQPGLPNAEAGTGDAAALRFVATYGPVTGREYATARQCERPAGTANNSLVRCKTGEARGSLRWILTSWHVAEPTAAQTQALVDAAQAVPGHDEDVYAPGLATARDEADSMIAVTRTRTPQISAVHGASALPTRGGRRVTLQVSDAGPSWLSVVSGSVVYSNGDGVAYSAGNCSVSTPHTAIQCDSVVGYGGSLAWVVALDGRPSEVFSGGSYEPPVITALNVTVAGAVDTGEGGDVSGASSTAHAMSTRGGELVIMRGSGFGPAGTVVSAVYAAPGYDGISSATANTPSAGSVGGPYAGRTCFVAIAHSEVHCVTAPGVGSGLLWNLKVGTGSGALQSGPYAAAPVSYAGPRIGSISGAGAFRANTEGAQPLVLSGSSFGLATYSAAPASGDVSPSQYPPTVTYGPASNPSRYTASNCRVDGASHGRVVCMTVPGTGRAFVYVLSIAKQVSAVFRPEGLLADTAGYAAPVVSAYLGDGPNGRPRGSTEGGDRVEIQGKNFGPAGVASLEQVYYGHLGLNEYSGQTCSVLDHTRLQCLTAPGAGDQLQWTVVVDGQQSEAPSTAYAAPEITGFAGAGASNASSLGGETIELIGRNFGPPRSWSAGRGVDGGDYEFLEWVKYGPTGAEYSASDCAVVSHTVVRCTIVPGSGSGLVWKVRVQGQTSQPSPEWSYRAPVVAGITPSSGPSSGKFRVTLVGTDFAVMDNFTSATVTVGDSPRELPAVNARLLDPSDPVIAQALGEQAAASSSGRRLADGSPAPYEALDFVMPAGSGRSLPLTLFLRMSDPTVGTSVQTEAVASVSFRFDYPVISQVFTRDNSQELPGSILLLIRGSSFGASAATGRVRLGYTYVEPTSWTHDLVTVVSPALEGETHIQVWRGDPTGTVDKSQEGAVFVPEDSAAGSALPNPVQNETDADWVESNGAAYSQRQPTLSPDMLAFFEPGAGATQPTLGQQLLSFEAQNIGADGNLTQVLIGMTQLEWTDSFGDKQPVFPRARDNECALTGDPVLVNESSSGESGTQRFRITCVTPEGQGLGLMTLEVLFAGTTSLDPSQPISLPYLPPTLSHVEVDGSPGQMAGEWVVPPVEGVRAGLYKVRVPTTGQRVTIVGENLGLIGYVDRFVTPDHPDFNAIMPVEATPGDYATTRYGHTSATFDIPAGVAHSPFAPGSPAESVVPPGMSSPAPLEVLRGGSSNTTLSMLVGHPSFEYQTADDNPPQTFAASVVVVYDPPTVSSQVHTGPTDGGVVIDVIGENFGASYVTAPTVTVAGQPCTTLNSAGQPWVPGDSRVVPSSGRTPHQLARCVLPAGAGRDQPVHVRVGEQQTGSVMQTSVAKVHYNPPVIYGVWPQTGPTNGGINVTIWGENFAGANGDFIDLLSFEAVADYHPTANPNASVVDRASPSRQSGRLVFANHSAIVVELPPGQGGAKSIHLVVAGQQATTRWSAALPASSSDGVTEPAGNGPLAAHSTVPVFRYERPVITKVSGACPTTGCEIVVTGRNFGTPVQTDGAIEPAVTISPPAVLTDATQDQPPFSCTSDSGRPANESHTHFSITCIVPEGMGSKLQLTVKAGTQVSEPVLFSYMPPELRLFLPNAPSALGEVRLRLRGINLGTAIAPVNITLNDEPCDDAELLTPHTQAVCTARKTVVGSKNVSVFVAWQQRFFSAAQRLVAFECPARYYGQPGEFCLACPQGAVCEGPVCQQSDGLVCTEYIEPYSAPGWWRAYATTPTEEGLCPELRQNRPGKFAGTCPTFVPCEPAGACLGSNICAEAYAGERCAVCAEDYFRYNSECAKCPDMPWVAPLLLGVGLICVCIAGYTLQRNEQLNIGPFLVAIDFFQVLAIYARSKVNWPSLLTELFQILSVFNLNLELVNPECIVENVTFDLKFIAVLALPLALAFVFGVLHIAKYTYNLCILRYPAEKRNEHLPLLVGSLWSMTYVLYLVETSQVMAGFNCSPTNPPDSAPHGYLQAVFEPCYVPGGVHERILPYAYAGLVLYVIAFPLAVGGVLWKNKENLKLDQLLRCKGLGYSQSTSTRSLLKVRQLYSRLYAPFRPGAWWFCLALLVRKAGIAVVALIFRRNASFQLGAILVILLLAYAMQVRFKPWMGPAQYEEERLYHEAKVASEDAKHLRIESRLQDVMRRLRRTGTQTTMETQARRRQAMRRREGAMASAFNLNMLDQFLISVAVFVALAGVCFESDFFEVQGLDGYRDFLTVLVIMAVAVAGVYVLLVIGSEFAEACCPAFADRMRRSAKSSDRSAIALAAEERKAKQGVTDMAYNPLQKLAAAGDKRAAAATGLEDDDDETAAAKILALLKQESLPTPSQWQAIKARLETMQRDVSGLNSEIRLLKRSEATAAAKATSTTRAKGLTGARGRQRFGQLHAAVRDEEDESPDAAQARKTAKTQRVMRAIRRTPSAANVSAATASAATASAARSAAALSASSGLGGSTAPVGALAPQPSGLNLATFRAKRSRRESRRGLQLKAPKP
ncbi:hypothetical protein FNF29_02052 [Cafeteria roenbergensis]|uniref:Staphylococcus aureus surface protein A n=1 Tax=Cafeteria roenbergensis TaxID=33653 RepID=A0A5A8CT13_CAFRO|nr:hypothetical protein FNF29_02052 [Cafeteria roenbergensis]|eukprot:KAA0154911.1 hypothetical protein FNF29_02052 [Cafeteria roenbergensis]